MDGRPVRQSMPYVRVQGSARERGRQYGAGARQLVARSLVLYEALFAHYSHIDWPTARRRAATYTEAIAAYAPGCLEEMAGIAEGAGCDFEDILALNVRSELRFAGPVAELAAASSSGAAPVTTSLSGAAPDAAFPTDERGECTAVVALPSATADGHTLLAQNWDWKADMRETNLLLEVQRDDGPNFLTMVEAGLLAKVGLNECGIGLVTNTLVSSLDRGEPGVPYHVVLRSIMDCEGITQVLERILSAQRSSSANYLVASREGLAANFECLPGDSGNVRVEAPRAGLFTHANHFAHAPGLARDHDQAVLARDAGMVLIPDSFFRQERLDELLRGQRVSVELLQTALRDHANHPDGICAHPREDEPAFLRSATIASVIMDLSAMKLWVADGNPCESPYRAIDCSTCL